MENISYILLIHVKHNTGKTLPAEDINAKKCQGFSHLCLKCPPLFLLPYLVSNPDISTFPAYKLEAEVKKELWMACCPGNGPDELTFIKKLDKLHSQFLQRTEIFRVKKKK